MRTITVAHILYSIRNFHYVDEPILGGIRLVEAGHSIDAYSSYLSIELYTLAHHIQTSQNYRKFRYTPLE